MRGLRGSGCEARAGLRAAFLGLLTLGLLACGQPPAEDHAARGVVKGVDAAARSVSIDHEDIPGFMEAMTMTFELAPEVSLEGIGVGSAVDFRVKREGGAYIVTHLEAAGAVSSGADTP